MVHLMRIGVSSGNGERDRRVNKRCTEIIYLLDYKSKLNKDMNTKVKVTSA